MSKHYIFVDFFFARSIKIDVIRMNGKEWSIKLLLIKLQFTYLGFHRWHCTKEDQKTADVYKSYRRLWQCRLENFYYAVSLIVSFNFLLNKNNIGLNVWTDAATDTSIRISQQQFSTTNGQWYWYKHIRIVSNGSIVVQVWCHNM